MPNYLLSLVAEGSYTTGKVLSSIVTSDMIGGVLDEIINVLPIVLPVAIGFIGIRKGLGFVLGTLHSA